MFDIWLLQKKNNIPDMKEQVENEPLGWSKEFSLLEREPLAFTKSGSVLCYNYHSLDIYDPISSTSKELVKSELLGRVFPHQITLVSLKELGEENVKEFELPKIEETENRGQPTIQLAR